MKRMYELVIEIFLTGLPVGYQVYRRTQNLTSAVLAFGLTMILVDRFLLNPARAWDNLALLINPFAAGIGSFVIALVYLNYTGTVFAAAKWQALGISLISIVLSFFLLRFWSG